MFLSRNNLRHEALEFNQMISLLRDEYRNIFDTFTYSYGIIKNQVTGDGV